jgi:hypothetical protein
MTEEVQEIPEEVQQIPEEKVKAKKRVMTESQKESLRLAREKAFIRCYTGLIGLFYSP